MKGMIRRKLRFVFIFSQTSAVRFFFSLCSLWVSALLLGDDYREHIAGSIDLLLSLAPRYCWASAFFVHGSSVLYGVLLDRYSKILLMSEGVLGAALWTAAGVALSISQSSISGVIIASLVSVWLLVRYPTHQEWENYDVS